jgi:hypothetical protein
VDLVEVPFVLMYNSLGMRKLTRYRHLKGAYASSACQPLATSVASIE